MYLSSVIFVILFLLDLTAGYFIAGWIGVLFVAAAIPIGIFVQMKLALYRADATKLEYLAPHDREKLAIAFESVLQRGESLGYTSRNPKIYLSEDNALNGFNAGNAIVINRGLMNSGCLEGVAAHEIKHFKFKDSYTSCLICNTITVLSLLAMFVLSIYVLVIAILIGLVVAIFGNVTAGFVAGSLVGRFLGKIKNIILRVNLFVMQALQRILSRFTELKADEFATRLGYGEQLKQFLRLTYESRKSESLSSRLLSTHPSDSKRIGNIQRIQNRLQQRGELTALPFTI